MDSLNRGLSRTFFRASRQKGEQKQRSGEDDWQTITDEASSWPAGDDEEEAKWHEVTDDECTDAVHQEHDERYFSKITDTSKRGFVKEMVNELGLGPVKGVVAKIGETAQRLKEMFAPKPLPTPEEIGCPCFNYPEAGWRACDVHRLQKAKELGLIRS